MPRDLLAEYEPVDLLADIEPASTPSKQPQDALEVLRSLGLGKEADEIANRKPIKRKGLAGVATDIAQGAMNAVHARQLWSTHALLRIVSLGIH